MQGPASWSSKYYKYRLEVYSPWSQRMEILEATDPYSRSLAADGARTQVWVCWRMHRLSSASVSSQCLAWVVTGAFRLIRRSTTPPGLAPVVCKQGSNMGLRPFPPSTTSPTLHVPWKSDTRINSLKCSGLMLQIVDLSAPELAPEGWKEESAPPQGPFTDISVYELHIRDFSATDSTVPKHLQGKYLAFSLVRNPLLL